MSQCMRTRAQTGREAEVAGWDIFQQLLRAGIGPKSEGGASS